MIEQKSLRLALRKPMLDTEGLLPSARLHFENRSFTPPTSGLVWGEERLSVLTSRLVSHEYFRVTGLYTWRLVSRINQGTETIEQLATDVVQAYAPPKTLTSDDGQDVIVMRVEPGNLTRDTLADRLDGHAVVVMPVTINWEAHVKGG